MPILEVDSLRKVYPGFTLDSVSFTLEKGRIMGLIGRNGAGKTTTLKSIFGVVHPDGGKVRLLGMDMPENEREIKRRVGYAGGGVDWYMRSPIRKIARVTSAFYPNWDENEYNKYLSAFSLDESKAPRELSEGMKVKFSLTLALSHKAELLILDEPTSGLDPVSRAELLDVFRFLRDKGVAILFSTHITTDLEKCADDITYIAKGKIIASGPLDAFLAKSKAEGRGESLEDIMVSYEKESLYEKLAD